MMMTLCCAHRGASGQAPENTLAALDRAARLGADMVEIDVQRTADDNVVLLHDASLERTTDGHGLLREQSLPALRRLDAGSWYGPEFAGEPIPTLAEALEWARDSMVLNIELKTYDRDHRLVELVIAVVRANNSAARCLVTSFDHTAVLAVKARAPELRAGFILGPGKPDARVFREAPDMLSVAKKAVDDDLLARARSAGKAVHVWTVDDPAAMRGFVDQGVEAIITNFPDRFPRRSDDT